MTWSAAGKLITNRNIILVIVLLAAVAISTHQYIIDRQSKEHGAGAHSYINNYTIFKQSFTHLAANKNLYDRYPDEYWDYYKYSPAFAVFFSPFTLMPDLPGLILWNVLNVMILLLAIYSLPDIDQRAKGLIVLFCLAELVTAMQNSQSNALVAGLIIFSFSYLEKGKYTQATLLMVLSAFIKLFGIIGFALFLMYPEKRKLVVYSFLWILFLALIPLMVVDFGQLLNVYSGWWTLLANDHSASVGISFFGVLSSWFHLDGVKLPVLVAGMILFLLPLVRMKKFSSYQARLFMLSSLLIWVVIFNHMAESPTYIIAFAGIAIWYFTTPRTPLNTFLFVFAFFFTSLSTTDLIPHSIRIAFFEPYHLKALPSILIWLKITMELFLFDRERYSAFKNVNEQ